MSLVGDIADEIVRGAVVKAVHGWVAAGDLTPAQGAELVDGVMVEIQLALEIYRTSQRPAAGGGGLAAG